MKHSFSYKEKLKSRKLIQRLFTEANAVSKYPLKMIYLPLEPDTKLANKQVSVSVSKRNFKKAVDRNAIKRLLREAYRTQKDGFIGAPDKRYIAMFLYLGKTIPTQKLVNEKMQGLADKFSEKNKINTPKT